MRINPHEVSISDPNYIDEIFAGAIKSGTDIDGHKGIAMVSL